MRSRLAAMLMGVFVLAGCDIPAADSTAQEPVPPSEAQASGPSEAASEPSEAASSGTPSEATEASEPATEQPEGEDGDDERKRERRRLAAVRPGDSGAKVKALQRRLNKLGFAAGPADGAYGPRTEAAVEAFQMLVDLKQTGKADARTIAALETFESDAPVVRAGDEGREVRQLQRRLADGPFDPGKADGEYGAKTVQAVWALEKLAGVPVDGDWGPLDEHAWEQLQRGEIGAPKKRHKKRWVEVDLSEQLMKVYDPGEKTPVLVSHVSTGSGVPWSNGEHSGSSVTPLGDFVISRRIAGWRESSLDIGRLYNPLYFNGGIALHGALSVPLYPASHGCVRVPMHIAEYLPDELPNGTPVHVLS